MLANYEKTYTLDEIPDDLDSRDRIIYKLIDKQANDLNSSTFREAMTLTLLGYDNCPGKLGYDGLDCGRHVEVKPKNFTGKSKLSGSGNFTDFTWARLDKYTRDNVKMVVSGFYKGKIVYIIEFDFCEEQFRDRLCAQLTRRFPDGDIKGQYLRSASFGWKHFNRCSSLQLKYLSPRIDEYSNGISRNFYKLLLALLT